MTQTSEQNLKTDISTESPVGQSTNEGGHGKPNDLRSLHYPEWMLSLMLEATGRTKASIPTDNASELQIRTGYAVLNAVARYPDLFRRASLGKWNRRFKTLMDATRITEDFYGHEVYTLMPGFPKEAIEGMLETCSYYGRRYSRDVVARMPIGVELALGTKRMECYVPISVGGGSTSSRLTLSKAYGDSAILRRHEGVLSKRCPVTGMVLRADRGVQRIDDGSHTLNYNNGLKWLKRVGMHVNADALMSKCDETWLTDVLHSSVISALGHIDYAPFANGEDPQVLFQCLLGLWVLAWGENANHTFATVMASLKPQDAFSRERRIRDLLVVSDGVHPKEHARLLRQRLLSAGLSRAKLLLGVGLWAEPGLEIENVLHRITWRASVWNPAWYCYSDLLAIAESQRWYSLRAKRDSLDTDSELVASYDISGSLRFCTNAWDENTHTFRKVTQEDGESAIPATVPTPQETVDSVALAHSESIGASSVDVGQPDPTLTGVQGESTCVQQGNEAVQEGSQSDHPKTIVLPKAAGQDEIEALRAALVYGRLEHERTKAQVASLTDEVSVLNRSYTTVCLERDKGVARINELEAELSSLRKSVAENDAWLISLTKRLKEAYDEMSESRKTIKRPLTDEDFNDLLTRTACLGVLRKARADATEQISSILQTSLPAEGSAIDSNASKFDAKVVSLKQVMTPAELLIEDAIRNRYMLRNSKYDASNLKIATLIGEILWKAKCREKAQSK